MCQGMTLVGVRKIQPAILNWCNSSKIQLFDRKSTHSSHPNCHSTCPLPIEYYSLERTSRLYESLQWSRAAPILHQQSDFEFWRVIFRPLTSLFSKISSFSNFPPHGPRPWMFSNFSLSLWIELRFCLRQAMTFVGVREI